MKVFSYILPVVVLGFPAYAEEVNIGHLETNDDSALNWAFFHCNLLLDRVTMRCDIFTTILYKSQDKDTETLKHAIGTNPALQVLKQFWSIDCGETIRASDEFDTLIKKGVDVQGMPLNNRVILGAALQLKDRYSKGVFCQNGRREEKPSYAGL